MQSKLTATKIFTFDAAHYLPNHPGLCKNLHGHRWTLEVTIKRPKEAEITDNTPPDMIMDFGKLKQIVKSNIIDVFDHTCINDNPEWPNGLRPTAENMIEVIAEELSHRGLDEWLTELKLWETPTSYVTWTKGE
jgi:6-pyruvoyltetrahydropterin/6-carboxytetrahydropterin synthase